ncbi:HTTM domain-containing protein [Methyloglobulus sp.]|uniref:HTTM domain-containing protein n=1 Tax=Methyloglobulus sp. TaxID=2518622 RepID=UPI0032B84F91
MQDAWANFWFKPIDARQYAALRIAFGSLSAIYFVQLLPYVEAQFSGSGWLGDIQQIAIQNGGSWSLLFISTGIYATTFAYAVVILGIASAFLMMIGWQSRITVCITWLVWVSLWNRNPLLLDGDDAVLKMMCLYLMLSPCGNCWSVDAYVHKMPQHVAVWSLRLMQFQIALIYFVSGWVKFHSPEWLNGTIMQYVLIHPHYSRWDGWAIIDKPMMAGLLSGLAGFIRWWELLFPLLLLNTNTRKLSILIGIAFHVGLLLTMNLRWFAVIMLSLYIALMPNSCLFQGMKKRHVEVDSHHRN